MWIELLVCDEDFFFCGFNWISNGCYIVLFVYKLFGLIFVFEWCKGIKMILFICVIGCGWNVMLYKYVSDVVLIVNSSKNSLLCSLIILIEKGEIVFKVGSSKMDCMLG